MQINKAYFDHNATTALDPRVLEAMIPYLSRQNGNPASRHWFGRMSRQAIDHAREQVANAVEAHPSQIVFTSGGTESNNLAIRGISTLGNGQAIAVSAIEHPCVMNPAKGLQKHGIKVNTIDVDENGKVIVDSLLEKLKTPTGLVSVMLANNETGVIQNIDSIAQIARDHHALVHTDAVQALGKIDIDFNALHVHAMTLSSHKINGPHGVGALVIDKRVDLIAQMLGGGQERGLRSGTENLAAIVGFGAACELLKYERLEHAASIKSLRDALEIGLRNLGARIFGVAAERLPNTSFFAFEGIDGETLVMAMDRKGYAVASGSACSSDSTEPSHVLLAMGIQPDMARGAIRVSLSSTNSMEEIESFLTALANEISRFKQLTAIAV